MSRWIRRLKTYLYSTMSQMRLNNEQYSTSSLPWQIFCKNWCGLDCVNDSGVYLCAIMCNKQVNNVIKLENCQLPCKFPCTDTMVAKVPLPEAYPGALVYGLKLKFYTMLQMHHIFVGRIAYKKCRDAAYCYRCSMGLCMCLLCHNREAIQKRPNRSRCRLGCGLGWARKTM